MVFGYNTTDFGQTQTDFEWMIWWRVDSQKIPAGTFSDLPPLRDV